MRHQGRTAMLAAVVAVGLAVTGSPAVANESVAVEPNQVQGLSVRQGDGYATLSWIPVPGATDYQIERTPVDANDNPIGAAQIRGVWRPERQVRNDSPTFADAGFNPGDRFRWRVRARFGTAEQPFSEPVFGTTRPYWGDPDVPGQNLRTQWERTAAAQFTSYEEELAYTDELVRLSERVRVVEIARTAENRAVNMLIIGYPTPPATPEAVAATSPLLINCNVHGNEPSDREACFILARHLAFGDDARTLDLLSRTTVLIVPSINGDGRAHNTRGNTSGQDLNRDYSLIRQPETFGFVNMLRQYRPVAGYDGHEYGNSNAGDLPMLPPRHANVARSIFDESLRMIENHMYERGADDGWWPCPYGCQGGGNVGLGEETILRNNLGLKNVVNSLLELRSSGGATRPNEGSGQENRRRKTFSALWTFNQFLDYYRANLPAILQAREEAITFQISNTGRVVFRGSYPIPAHPAPHPGQAPPPVDAPLPSRILEEAPCAYSLTEEQYNSVPDDRPAGSRTTVAQRIAAHGWKVVKVGDRYVVPMTQPERGLIPLLLDAQAVEGMVAAERVYPALTGRHDGKLTVSGVLCVDEAQLTGPVTVAPGALLIATRSAFDGPVNASGAAGVFLANNTVVGPLRVSGSAGVLVASNQVTGPVEVSDNRDEAALVLANTVVGPLRCADNSSAPLNLGIANSVTGPKEGQCAGL